MSLVTGFSIILGVQAVVFLAAVTIIVVLIIRRVKEKKNETFEKRDN